MQGFLDFMKEWGVIGLAVAVIIGGKLNEWVSAMVDDILMPLISLFGLGGNWREASLQIGDAELLLGHFLGATIDFLIVAFLIYFFFTRVLKNEEATTALESKKAG